MLKTWTAAIAATLLLCATPARTAQTATPEMFGALPTMADAELSPDGKTIVALQHVGDDIAIVFYDIDNPGSTPKGTRIESALAHMIYWANDDTALVLVSQSGKREAGSRLMQLEIYRWLAIHRETLKSTVLFDNEPGYYVPSPGRLLATLPEEPDELLFSRWTVQVAPGAGMSTGTRRKVREHGGAVSLMKANLKNGRAKVVEAGRPETSYWVVDPTGAPAARVDLYESLQATEASPLERRFFTRQPGSSSLKLTRTDKERRQDVAEINLRGVSATTGNLLATAIVGDRRSIFEFNAETGELGAPVSQHPQHDVGAIYDSRRAAVVGGSFLDDMVRHEYFDAADREVYEMLKKALPNAAPLLWSDSADRSRYVVKVNYTDHPAQWFLFDRNTKELSMLGTTYQSIDGKTYAQKEKFDYVASDGLTIPGYLTAPAEADEGPLPMIVLPHGGPWARDDQSFDYWSFFYAARGYLVYQPNFRGSSGYGERFRLAGDGEWGRKMQDDITEGVQKLIAEGRAAADRICIVGASYGGYAALAGATLTPDLYACAVSVNGVSSVSGLIAQGARSGDTSRAFWEERIGSRFDMARLDEISPQKQAWRAKAPIMLIHAKDDTIVPLQQSRDMARLLAERGVEHTLVELPGEDHWLSTARTRTQMLQYSIEFIDSIIGPNAGAGPAAD